MTKIYDDENSPAKNANLEEYLDFIMYNPEANLNILFSEYLKMN